MIKKEKRTREQIEQLSNQFDNEGDFLNSLTRQQQGEWLHGEFGIYCDDPDCEKCKQYGPGKLSDRYGNVLDCFYTDLNNTMNNFKTNLLKQLKDFNILTDDFIKKYTPIVKEQYNDNNDLIITIKLKY